MTTTARKTENDGRQWYQVNFDQGDTMIIGLTQDGTWLDEDGCPLGQDSRSRTAMWACAMLPAAVYIDGKGFDSEAVRNLMDDDLCEQINAQSPSSIGVPSTEQEFLDAYRAAHLAKYGEAFRVN